MSQQEDADSIIRDIQENGLTDFIKDSMTDYMAEYHPPKDELLEKWRDFLEWFDPALVNSDRVNLKANFNEAKKRGLFTYVLYKALEHLRSQAFEDEELELFSKFFGILRDFGDKYNKPSEE